MGLLICYCKKCDGILSGWSKNGEKCHKCNTYNTKEDLKNSLFNPAYYPIHRRKNKIKKLLEDENNSNI